MRLRSLSSRLIVSSAAVSLVLLAAAALLLGGLFSAALERNFDARLRAVLDGLLANVELDESGALVLAQQLADTRFTIPLSGWYWQVTPPAESEEVDLASQSLLETRLVPEPAMLAVRDRDGVAGFYFSDSQEIDGRAVKLRAIQKSFQLPGSEAEYSFVVAGNFDELRQEVQSFRRTMFLMLGLLGAGLLAAMFLQVKFGLRPLRKMQEGLSAIREGRADHIEGDYPTEIDPVVDELNLLIKSNTEIIERARTQVGNLAHALKTPLSVLTNEAGAHKGPLASKVVEQTQVMRDHVSLYLDRARRAARAQGLGAVTDVQPILDALARTLQRIHRDRGITITIDCQSGLKFRGEKQDFEEMAGNLLDNASKWTSSKVMVTAYTDTAASQQGRTWLTILVDDNGPGILAEKRAEALKRGQRLDETKPGSGLGLSIVKETAAMYNGGLTLEHAPIGGLRANLKLPSAQ